MPFSSGVFSRLYSWATDKAGGVKIRADRMDAEMDGMATALSSCILKDGTQTITAAIPFNGQAITGAGAITSTGTVTGNKFVGTNQPCFSAHKNGSDQASIASETPTKVTFGTEIFDIGSYFAANAWTPPAGLVYVSGRIAATGASAETLFSCNIYKNGTLFKQGADWTTNTTPAEACAIIDRASGTDYYELFVSGTSASTITVLGTASATYFMGFAL
jgi:hypothetical protein